MAGAGAPGAGGSSGPSIAGLVVRITNNEPIPHARILLTKVDGGLSDSVVVSTDNEGRFGAVNVGPGTYRLFAEHEDHIRTESAAVTVGPGQQIRNIIVRMTPTAVITGRVVDEHNDPVSKVYVRAATKDLIREAQTNDLGDWVAGRRSGLGVDETLDVFQRGAIVSAGAHQPTPDLRADVPRDRLGR